MRVGVHGNRRDGSSCVSLFAHTQNAREAHARRCIDRSIDDSRKLIDDSIDASIDRASMPFPRRRLVRDDALSSFVDARRAVSTEDDATKREEASGGGSVRSERCRRARSRERRR